MTGRRCYALLTLGLLLVLISVRPAEAVNPETLLMPGKLSAAHVKYEEQCSLCHDRPDRNRQTQLCLDCHKEIAGDLKQRRGFHGKSPGIDVSQCRACHSEHLGREADIVKLSHEQFNHENTDYPLRGAHADVVCESCHAAGKRYRDAPRECIGCHRKDRKSTRLNSSHLVISYAVFCLKKTFRKFHLPILNNQRLTFFCRILHFSPEATSFVFPLLPFLQLISTPEWNSLLCSSISLTLS